MHSPYRKGIHTMPAIVIRNAAEADSPIIAALVSQLGYPSSEEEIRARLAALSGRPDYRVWVAVSDGRVVGLTGVFLHYALEYNGLHGRLLGLVVDEPYRGKGIGEQLMAWTERWLLQHGVDKLTLTSGKQRALAHAFYRRLGYQETGFRFGKRLAAAESAEEGTERG
jgi:GNAT superfamily N-acetyltransferase